MALGSFEAAADAILYEFDPAFRKRARALQRSTDITLGASLRRLRLTKGLRRDDFPNLSSKEVARIERNQVKPRASTLRVIASALRVPVRDLGSY